MSSIIEINNFIQNKLNELGVNEISAIEMAKYLDEEGLLKDSKQRPGLPLRNYLRSGRIEGAYQHKNRRWEIRRIDREQKLTIRQAASVLKITEQALYKRIERGSIVPEKVGERISIPVSELEKVEKTIINNKKHEDTDSNIGKEFAGIYFEIENLFERVKRLEEKLKIILNNKNKE